jgi:hypothetical protein
MDLRLATGQSGPDPSRSRPLCKTRLLQCISCQTTHCRAANQAGDIKGSIVHRAKFALVAAIVVALGAPFLICVKAVNFRAKAARQMQKYIRAVWRRQFRCCSRRLVAHAAVPPVLHDPTSSRGGAREPRGNPQPNFRRTPNRSSLVNWPLMPLNQTSVEAVAMPF